MTGIDCLIERWEKTIERATHRAPAIYDASRTPLRTFDEIEEESRLFQRQWFDHFKPGEVIAVQTGNHAAWPALLLACLRNGLVTIPLEQNMADHERNVALRVCHAAAIIETKRSSERNEQIALRPLSQDPVDWGSNPPALLKLTSGTTAAPRAIRFRSHQLLADCDQICQTMEITGRDLNLAVIPFSHSYGLSNLITPLIARGVPIVLNQDRIPRAVLDGLARSKATVFPGTPVFYQAFSEMTDLPALPNLRLCISAGAPLPLETARKFRECFQRPIHSFYGASECGGICYDREAKLLDEGFVGQAMHGVDLTFLDSTAASGRIQIRSAAVGDRYFPERDEERLGHGQFTPDDLLTPSSGGYRIVGRISDLINVAGKKVNPAEVEAALLRFDGIRAAAVFGRESALRNEEVAACVVAAPGIRESDLLKYCRECLSSWAVPKQIFFVDEIPTTERGKINRRELAGRLRG